MADVSDSPTEDQPSRISGSEDKRQTESCPRPGFSMAFSMAHALNIARRRKESEEQTKVKKEKSQEDEKKEKARAKRQRRRRNQKLAKAKAKSKSDGVPVVGDEQGCTDSEADDDDEGERGKQEELAEPDMEIGLERQPDEASKDSSAKAMPKKKKKKKPKAKTEAPLAASQTFDDEAFKASLKKMKSMIPRALMVKKKGHTKSS